MTKEWEDEERSREKQNEKEKLQTKFGQSEHHIILKMAKRFESIYMEQ